MNVKALNFIKNFSYTLSSNLISLMISTLVTLIIPKIIGVESYGYWQLYLLYVSYVGFFHLGWNDGIYLRYGGEDYEELDKSKFFSQFISLLSVQILFALILSSFSWFIIETDRVFILYMVSLNIVLMNVRYFFLFILQATNRISEYAKVTILDRVLFIALVLIMIVLGTKDYKPMVIADVTGKSISLIYAGWLCKDIVLHKLSDFYLDLKETIANISAGMKLLFANLASSLIIGVVRFGIERAWDVETFGKVSLILSISHFMMIFINGVGIVLYPILRRTNPDKLRSIYGYMRDVLMVIALGLLIFYYPFRIILSAWLPNYSDGLAYMALLFPLVVYEGKISLLINTYLKTLREEKVMMHINVISLVFSATLTLFSTVIFHNLTFAVLSILIAQIFRAVLSELYLSYKMDLSMIKDIMLELGLTFIFVTSGWGIQSWLTVVVYGVAYILYLLIKRKDIVRAAKIVFNLLEKKN